MNAASTWLYSCRLRNLRSILAWITARIANVLSAIDWFYFAPPSVPSIIIIVQEDLIEEANAPYAFSLSKSRGLRDMFLPNKKSSLSGWTDDSFPFAEEDWYLREVPTHYGKYDIMCKVLIYLWYRLKVEEMIHWIFMFCSSSEMILLLECSLCLDNDMAASGDKYYYP